MNATDIQQMVWHLPPPETKEGRQHGFHIESPLIDHETSSFLEAYRNLRFGWSCARRLARAGIPFPGTLEGDDEWVWRAYLYNRDRMYWNPAISHALSLTNPSQEHARQIIEALLITPDATAKSVAECVNYPVDVITAYEKLFFNVLDRKSDELYIASIVYPAGRLVEMYDEYARIEPLASMLMRSGFNNGKADVAYLAGLSSGLIHTLSSADVPAKLESMIMANGFVLARNGFLNQRADAAGLRAAQTLLAAAKQGGEDNQAPSYFSASLGSSLLGEITRVKQQEAKIQAANYARIKERSQQSPVSKN